jgi:hypothetical protein
MQNSHFAFPLKGMFRKKWFSAVSVLEEILGIAEVGAESMKKRENISVYPKWSKIFSSVF